MNYDKVIRNFKEYAGESFSQQIIKENDQLWSTDEVATYTMYDTAGTIITSGNLITSSNKESIGFTIAKLTTKDLLGNYKIIVDLGDSNDISISEAIAEYNIKYMARKA